jgi:hypothetical protein
VEGKETALTNCAGRIILESEHWEIEDLEIKFLKLSVPTYSLEIFVYS